MLADALCLHGKHLNANGFPFTMLFRGITEYITWIQILYCVRRLCFAARTQGPFSWKERAMFSFRIPTTLQMNASHRRLFRAAATYVGIVPCFCSVASLLGFDDFGGVVITSNEQALSALSILDGWKIAKYYILKDGVCAKYARTYLPTIGRWHRTNAWPTASHREASHALLSRLKCEIRFQPSMKLDYQTAILLLVNRRARFLVPQSFSTLDSVAFKKQLLERISNNRTRILDAWKTVLRRIMRCWLKSDVYAAPFTSGITMHLILMYLSNPTNNVSDIVEFR